MVAEHKLGVTERRATRFDRVREIPFTSERKMMSTIALDHEHGDALMLITKGAPDVLLARCDARARRHGRRAARRRAPQRILADVDSLSDEALRTLAVAYRPLRPGEERGGDEALERDLVFAGTVGIIDPPREEAAVAIARRAGPASA